LTEQDKIKEHILKTIDFYKVIRENKTDFLAKFSSAFPKFTELINSRFTHKEIKLAFLYCSLNKIDAKYTERYSESLAFMDYPILRYFIELSKTISKSTRFELLKFLNFNLKDIGFQQSATEPLEYSGFLLPESPSGFPEDYKIVSFLIQPQRLLEQAYVLRKDSWRDRDCLYQRLLIKNKIKNMRKYLQDENRVFVNNIIVTLPGDTVITDSESKKLIEEELDIMQIVTIKLKKEFNTIGIVDGQHRVFTYHEGRDDADALIAKLREKQHLLLTGIIYPKDISESDRIKFEAQLFLEINDKQTRTRGDLKQAIQTIVAPYSTDAIAKNIILKMGETGPLTGCLEEHFYDKGKIKTTSIVSYGLKHIVRIDGEHSLFTLWQHQDKQKVSTKAEAVLKNKSKTRITEEDKLLLTAYENYCANVIDTFIKAFKDKIEKGMWVNDNKLSRVLTTTTINGLIFCLRKLIENNKIKDGEYYRQGFSNLKINFKPEFFRYKSSHWKALGDEIYKQCFSD
jgi:DGQHR domain-containing protein